MEYNFDFNKVENKENLPITTDTINTTDLINLIYKGDNFPQDNRFLPTDEGGVFEYFEIKDLSLHPDDKFYPIIKIGDKIVGLSELLKDPFNNKNLWIQFLSIDPKEQNNGYASRLAKEIFKFAKNNNYTLETSHYTEKGFEKLKPVFERLSEEYSVDFINKGKL